MEDDRRSCTTCRNLEPERENGDRCCAAARRGELAYLGQSRLYRPVLDPPRRCEAYLPLPGDPDQRTGAERWPSLVAPVVKRLRWSRDYPYRASAEQVAAWYAKAEKEALIRRPYYEPNYMSSESELVGLCGEVELGAFLGIEPRWKHDGSDDGWDFDVRGTLIDAKAARNPNDLTHPTKNGLKSQIYVLCGYDDAFRQAVNLRWDLAERLAEAPKRMKRGSDGKPSERYCLPFNKVRYTMADWPKDLFV